MLSKSILHPASLVGFAISSVFAITEKWSLPEFCWSTWLAGLIFSYLSIVLAAIGLLIHTRKNKSDMENSLPILTRVSPFAYFVLIFILASSGAYIGFHFLSLLFGFYGLFLSVFAEMEPTNLFGRNGFINSDFFTPVSHLLVLFWPMVLGTIISNTKNILGIPSIKAIIKLISSDLLRIHLMTLFLPFLSLLSWMIFHDNFQPITIILLMAIFYFLPSKKGREIEPNSF